MAYSDQEIKNFIQQQGIQDNPYALYNYAKQYGVAPGRIDQVMGYAPGTSDRWIQQQGLQGLAGGAVGGTAPTQGNYSADQVKQFIADKGISDNPQAIHAYAQQYGVQPGQIESAMGYAPGAAANWQQQAGLAGQTPAGYSAAQPTAAQPAPQQASQPATQQPGMPSMGQQYQQNPTANPYLPMAGGRAPQGGQGGAGRNPYLQSGFAPPWDNANPNTQWMAGQISQGVTDHLQRNLLPGIRSAASAAGGLGGSRQGIAEGIAVGDAAKGLSSSLAGLYGNQYNQDRGYGLQSDALDLNVYNTNQNWMRQGQQDQLGLADRLLGWNQNYGVGNATQAQNAPLNYWQQFGNQASQFAGLGGSQTQNMQGNPYLGALGGGMAAGQLWKSWGG